MISLEILRFAIWFLISGAIVGATHRAIVSSMPLAPRSVGYAYAICLSIGVITLASMLLGMLGLLTPVMIMIVLAVAAAMVGVKPLGDSSFGSAAAEAWTLATSRRWPASAVLLTLFSFLLLSFWGIAFGWFDHTLNWDSLAYHLVFVDQWRSSGWLFDLSQNKWFFPAGAELLNHWFAISGSSQAGVPLAGWAAAVLCLLAGIALMQMFDLHPVTIALAVIALAVSPLLFLHLITAKNDLYCGAMLMTALVAALRATDGQSRGDSMRGRAIDRWVFATACALAIGAKFYSAGYVVVLLAALILTRSQGRPLDTAWRLIGPLVTMTLLLAGPWYIRNLVVSGAPLYPSDLLAIRTPEVAEKAELFATSLIGSTASDRFFHWSLAVWRVIGPASVLTAVGVVGFLVFSVRKDASRTSRRTAVGSPHRCVAVLLGGWALIYAITPFVVGRYPGEVSFLEDSFVGVRLGTPWWVLCVVIGTSSCLAVAAKWLPEGLRPVATVAFLCCLAPMLDHHRHYDALGFDPLWLYQVGFAWWPWGVVLVAAGTLGLHAGWVWLGNERLKPGLQLTLLGAVLLAPLAVSANRRFVDQFAGVYGRHLDTSVFDRLRHDEKLRELSGDSAWVCVLTPRSWPFAGPASNRRLSSAHGICAIPRRFKDVDDLRRYLKSHKFTHVVVEMREQVTRELFESLIATPDDLATKIYSDPHYRIYRLAGGSIPLVDGEG